MRSPLLMLACVVFTSSIYAQDCVKNLRGETVCKNGQSAAAYNPKTGNAAAAQKNANGVTTTQTSNGGTATTKNGSGTAHNANSAVAVNSKTGNAAAAHTNSNGAKGKYHEGCTTK